MNRRRFLESILVGGAGIVAAIKLTACGDDDTGGGGGDGGGGGGCASPRANIGSNHSHSMTVSAADVAAGAAKAYDITATAGHPHQVMLVESHFTQLQRGQTVTVTSTRDGAHSHSVTISC